MESSEPIPAPTALNGTPGTQGADGATGVISADGASATASPPFPIEIALADGTVLRGIEHPADGPPLLFVHDLGDDLDAWGSVAPDVRSAGFRVICLELRGHGLSDGEADPSATVGDLTGALNEVAGAFGPVGLVAYGAVSRIAFGLGTGDGAPIHAVISPAPPSGAHDGLDEPSDSDDPDDGRGEPGDGNGAGDDLEATSDGVAAMRVLFTGAHDEPAHEYVRNIHSSLRGQNMWISTGTVLRGPALLQEHPHLVEQLVMYMRRHLTAHHLAWIAEHAPGQQDSDEHAPGRQDSDHQVSPPRDAP